MSNLVEGGQGFLNLFKRGNLQKKLGNPGLDFRLSCRIKVQEIMKVAILI